MKTETFTYPMPKEPKTASEILRMTYPVLAALASMASVVLVLSVVDQLGK
ncbi:MAG: hypothetical protein KIS92_26880 [Planctomycetota bacterium]|nr:hypothetical protein [Planctomycetota bacterium]